MSWLKATTHKDFPVVIVTPNGDDKESCFACWDLLLSGYAGNKKEISCGYIPGFSRLLA